MTYFKIEDKQYLDYTDYRKILSVSSEIIGDYKVKVNGIQKIKVRGIEKNKDINTILEKEDLKDYSGKDFKVSYKKVDIKLDKNVFELTKKRYPNIIDNICHNTVYDKKNDVIIKKTMEMKFKENKNKLKNELLTKSKNDPDFVFGKKESIEKYKKLYDDIDKAKNQTELKSIIF